jgi:serine/threonine protein kinase
MSPRFALRHAIGRGRHCTVWLAADRETGRDAAVKVGPRGSLDGERDVLAQVTHANVVRAIAHGAWDCGRDFIAMEFASRGPVRPGPLPADEVETVLVQSLAALQSVHAEGFVHRDIKPAHLLLRRDGSVCLADFGTACRIGVRGEAGTATGTPRYAAPELTQGAPATAAMDIYSLGACAYELVTGKPVFQGETMIELFSQHVRARPPQLPAALAAWQPLLHAMLAKDAKDRPRAQDVAARLPSLSGAFA